jgi:hypothetical protein
MDEAEKLKKQIDVLQKKLALYEKDATYRAFYSLNRIVNQMVDYLNGFDLSAEIKANPKEDKIYDRAKGLWESLKTITSDLKALKTELGLNDEEEEKERKIKNKITTPESIANVLGNTAGQQG